MDIRIDDLSDPRISEFLDEHLNDMQSVSPPESSHALDLEGLKQPEVTFWSVWEDGELVGCGALKALSADHGEIKSMRIASSARGRGIASTLLQHMIAQAHEKGMRRLSLETGSMDFFAPARRLYEKFGFTYCPPFADYKHDPHSVFMSLELTADEDRPCRN